MKTRNLTPRLTWLLLISTPLFGLLAVIPTRGGCDEPALSWKKTVLDRTFRSEGLAVADVNRDGKLDILAGEVWYEAPDWKRHEIQPPGNYGDGAHGYSHCFACWTEDVNHDGWPDFITIDFPGAP